MIYIILLTAGSSERFGKKSKFFEDLNGSPVFLHSLKTFEKLKEKKKFIIVCREKDQKKINKILKEENIEADLVTGGQSRQDSMIKGFEKLKAKNQDKKVKKENLRESQFPLLSSQFSVLSSSHVIVHNSANPLVTLKEIKNCLQIAKKTGVSAVANKIVDTVKSITAVETLQCNVSTVDRQNLYTVQTPQIIRFDILDKAIKQAKKDNFDGTDELSLIENLCKNNNQNIDIQIVPASRQNFKITYKEDLEFARKILSSQLSALSSQFSHRSR